MNKEGEFLIDCYILDKIFGAETTKKTKVTGPFSELGLLTRTMLKDPKL